MTAGEAAHGKDHVLILDTTIDLTSFIKTHTWETTPDIHDKTGSGTDDKSFRGGQKAKSMTIGGWTDDDTDTGPRALELMAGTTVGFERRPDGTGSGKRKQTGNVVIGKFNETGKNDDIFQWTCDLQITGSVTEGTQT